MTFAFNSFQVGDQVGTIGNPGNIIEPHLHIHAEVDGEGVPITLDENFLVRNQFIQSKGKDD